MLGSLTLRAPQTLSRGRGRGGKLERNGERRRKKEEMRGERKEREKRRESSAVIEVFRSWRL